MPTSPSPKGTTVLRFELTTQLMRLRSLLALAGLAGVPVAAALSFKSSAGHQNGTQGGLFGASPYSALNHAMASLEFIGPLLLPIVVALLASAIASADRDWGILRYLYVSPVTRARRPSFRSVDADRGQAGTRQPGCGVHRCGAPF